MLRKHIMIVLGVISIVLLTQSVLGQLPRNASSRVMPDWPDGLVTPTPSIQSFLPLVMRNLAPPPTPSPTHTVTPTVTPTPTPEPHCIYVGGDLCDEYRMWVEDSEGRRDWLHDMNGYMRMAYPGGLDWGAVFITFGSPNDVPRPGRDLSVYNTLSLELRGEDGSECVWIGIKDDTDPDDGETLIRSCVRSTDWERKTFPLSSFQTADLTRLHVVTEFVFRGAEAQTVDFRNIEYHFELLPTPTLTPTVSVTPSPTHTPTPAPTFALTPTSTATLTPTPEFTATTTPTPTPAPQCIYPIPGGAKLCPGYGMGVDDSAGRGNWLADMDGYMRMNYPGQLDWGAVYITVGEPRGQPRPRQDLSTYTTLSLWLRGALGDECVRVGIKDNTDPDDGSETKIRRCVSTTGWERCIFPLSEFERTADLSRLYVVTEFVFEGNDARRRQTMDFTNIEYLFLSTPTPEGQLPTQELCEPLPDLVATTLTAPASAEASQPIEISWVMTNQGTDEAQVSWYDRLYFSMDDVLDGEDEVK